MAERPPRWTPEERQNRTSLANQCIEQLGWSHGFYSRLINVNKSNLKQWLTGKMDIPQAELDWLVRIAAFVSDVPGFMDDELVPYPNFLPVMWTFGFDPFGFEVYNETYGSASLSGYVSLDQTGNNYDSAAVVFNVSALDLHEISRGEDGVSLVPRRFAEGLESLYQDLEARLRMAVDKFKDRFCTPEKMAKDPQIATGLANKIAYLQERESRFKRVSIRAARYGEIQGRAELTLHTIRRLWRFSQKEPLEVLDRDKIQSWMEEVYKFVRIGGEHGSYDERILGGPSDMDGDRFRRLIGLMGWWLDEEENHPSFPRVMGMPMQDAFDMSRSMVTPVQGAFGVSKDQKPIPRLVAEGLELLVKRTGYEEIPKYADKQVGETEDVP